MGNADSEVATPPQTPRHQQRGAVRQRDSASGSIIVGAPIQLGILGQPVGASIVWPRSSADAVLERTAGLDAARFWAADTNPVLTNPLSLEVAVPATDASAFFHLRRVQ